MDGKTPKDESNCIFNESESFLNLQEIQYTAKMSGGKDVDKRKFGMYSL